MIPLFKVYMSPESCELVNQTLQSGFISQGKKVDEFEAELKKYFNYPYILTVNSATIGLSIAIRLLNLPPGTTVLCTPLTCMATTCAVLENRLKIKWVDVDPDTCNMSLESLKRSLNPSIGAIIFVHWGGSPIDLEKLRAVAGNIPVIEDCAHAFGSKYKNSPLGTHGNLAVYSFQAIKHLTTGDGGVIFCRNEEEYKRCKLLRWFGISREKPPGVDFRLEEDIAEWGYKGHMNDINASIGLGNLKNVSELVSKHKKNAAIYNRKLACIHGVSLLKQVRDSESAYWIYTLKVADKPSFLDFMKKSGITVSQVHNRNDIHSCVSEFKSHLPNLDNLEKQIISIPVGWWLSEKEVEFITEKVVEWGNLYAEKKLGGKFEIRLLEKQDKNQYLSLLKELNGFECDPKKFDLVFEAVENGSKIYVLTGENGILISTARVYLDLKFYQNIARVEDVITKKEFRGRGAGRILLEYILKELKEDTSLDLYKIVLSTKEKNLGFYEKVGFEQSGLEMNVRI